jgi:hypothetical protein
MLERTLVYTYVVLFAISLLLEQPIPLAVTPGPSLPARPAGVLRPPSPPRRVLQGDLNHHRGYAASRLSHQIQL